MRSEGSFTMTQLDLVMHKNVWQVAQQSAMLDDFQKISPTISAVARASLRLDS